MKIQANVFYFRHFDTVRIIAAFMVFIHHMEQGFVSYKLKNYYNISIENIGRLGVLLFFVLSGFLITYLLLNEIKVSNTINLKKFYFKRILRIWPLYFLILIFAFVIAPNIQWLQIGQYNSVFIYKRLPEKLFLYFLFLNNLSSFVGPIPYAWHLWSICTEEQFYIIWPIILRKFVSPFIIPIIFFSYLLIRFIVLFFPQYGILAIFREWISLFIIDSMCIGAFFAYIFQSKNQKFDFLNNIYLFILILLISSLLIFYGVDFGFFNQEIYSILFGLLIFIVASNSFFQIKINESPFISYLGKISYGIYMYQAITIIIAFKILDYYNVNSRMVHYITSIILTLSISIFSFETFEKYFLNKKNILH